MKARRRATWFAVGAVTFGVLVAGFASSCGGDRAQARKVLVLGVDGLDPELLKRFVGEGVLPNFERLIATGDFKPLQTSMPPLSPIAWSTFITGMDPGGHGIFDFVHREAETMRPYEAMAGAVAGKTIDIGSWSIPVPFSGGGHVNYRKGEAFWQILEDHDVPTTVFRMPANFPPVDSAGNAFSGMGTPDLLGTPGTFSFYTDLPVPNAESITGGEVYLVEVVDDHVGTKLHGPPNTMRKIRKRGSGRTGGEVEYENPEMSVDLDVYLDPEQPVARLVVGSESFTLEQGEWSDWITVAFDVIPNLESVTANARFYLKRVRPDFELYVTPLQVNPGAPAFPVSTPESWAEDLFDNLGPFYTQELPEDTKALSHGILSGEEFWEQSQFVYGERRRALDYFLERFESGLLFFYFSSVDQGCHMLWRWADSDHPYYEHNEQLINGIRTLYIELDEALGHAMDSIDDDTTLIVMSDHGFCPFYWQVNLNTWLLENGYVTLKDPSKQGRYPWFGNVDWSKTRAYAAGLNGLYVNLQGREKYGIVPSSEYDALLDELERDLLELRDPNNGNQAVTLVTRTHRDFHGEYLDIGPDIIVGYNWGYRSSWKSPLGEFPKQVFEDNLDAWSGDHSVDYRVVPGVLLSNRPITMDAPALYDLTVAILDEYGIEKTSNMIGDDCLGAHGEDRAPSGRDADDVGVVK